MSKEKYGITDAHYLCDSAIFNTETNNILRLYKICDLLNQQDQQISDLEAKLAEKDQAIEGLQEINKSLGQTCNNDAKEIERLREELAEKEKELFARKISMEALTDAAKKYQISFCIEKLEKVKEFNSQRVFSSQPINDFIDNQIKQLKEMK